MQNSTAAAALVLLALSAGVLGQTNPVFEVASVKENHSGKDGGSLRFMPDGEIRAQNVPVRNLIMLAFDLKGYQVAGAPQWSRETRYDLQAKPPEAVGNDAAKAMLQALLVERFRLTFHREQRQLDGFRVVRARQDGLGPGIRRSRLDCEKATAEPLCRTGGITDESMKITGLPLSTTLLLEVSAVTGGPVVDNTALDGPFDFELRWCNEPGQCDDRPSFFTALEEQLGLRLERRRVGVDVLVIDRLERASPN